MYRLELVPCAIHMVLSVLCAGILNCTCRGSSKDLGAGNEAEAGQDRVQAMCAESAAASLALRYLPTKSLHVVSLLLLLLFDAHTKKGAKKRRL